MNRSGNYNRLSGRGNLYPFRPAVSNFVASTGLIPDFKGVMDGELHILGANWEGPHTRVEERLKRGDVGTTASDAAAKIHDLDYRDIGNKLRRGEISRDMANAEIRKSDNQLLERIKKGRKTDTSILNKIHAAAGDTGIKVKKIAEDIGLMDRTKFISGTGKGKSADPAHRLKALAKKSKVVRIRGGADAPTQSMDTKALKQLLETFPKDVLEKMNKLQTST
jgi:Phospholipase A2-like domain